MFPVIADVLNVIHVHNKFLALSFSTQTSKHAVLIHKCFTSQSGVLPCRKEMLTSNCSGTKLY